MKRNQQPIQKEQYSFFKQKGLRFRRNAKLSMIVCQLLSRLPRSQHHEKHRVVCANTAVPEFVAQMQRYAILKRKMAKK